MNICVVYGTRYEKCIQSFGQKPNRRRLLGRLRHRWDDNIKIAREEIAWEDVDWIHLTENRA